MDQILIQVIQKKPKGQKLPRCQQLNSVSYKNKLYFFGGKPQQGKQYKIKSEPFHIYDPEKNEFSQLEGINQQCKPCFTGTQICTTVNNILYVFGQTTKDGVISNQFHAFNFDRKFWIKLSKGQIFPQPRQGGTLVNYLDKFLVLFGGLNIKQNKSFEQFWIYNIQKNQWKTHQSISISSRTQQAYCCIKNRIYLFGGQWRVNQQNQSNKIQYLSGFYQIEMKKGQNEQQILNLYIRQIQFNYQLQRPRGRSGHKLLPIKKNKLLLVGGKCDQFGSEKKNNFKRLDDIWLFDILPQIWIRLQSDIQIPPIYQFACESIQNNQVYLFGGLQKEQKYNYNMYLLKLSMQEIQQRLLKIRHRNYKTCDLCYEIYRNKNQHMQSAFKVSNKMISQLIQNISHPFNAIGLFCDNALNYNSNYLKIIYSMFKGKPILIFEDDSKLNFDNIQYQGVTVNFEGGDNLNYNSVQKRSRFIIQKQNIKKQYGMNIKIGGLRLGNELLIISINSNLQARISLFTYEQSQYVSYFYVYDIKGKKLLDEYSQYVQQRILKQYGQLIKQFINSYLVQTQGTKIHPYRNIVFCMGLRQQNGLSQLIPNKKFTDLLYLPNPQTFQQLTKRRSLLLKSIDISLQTYLTMLYLKNDHTKISLQVRSPSPSYQPFRKIIVNQQLLDGVDQLIRHNLVYQIDAALNFQFKIVQLYLNPDLSIQFNIFHNGVLLYHRNRLIKRYGLQIGMLLDQCDSKNQQFFNMFGVLQLPDSLAINTIKNDFINQMMLDKFYSRLNFIGHWFKQNFNASIKTKIAYPKRVLPPIKGYYQPQGLQRQKPSKKVKNDNPHDQDYHQDQSSE